MNKILILGGYGNFGKRIAVALAKSGLPIIIAGRNKQKAKKLADEIKKNYPDVSVETAIFDINKALAEPLEKHAPKIVINTCGPFQLSNYAVPESCIKHNMHYIDLADGREFVTGITSLNDKAKTAGTLLVSGASTVPGLSSAVLEQYKDEFSQIDSLRYGISPGQKANRGLATTKAIMSYVGKPLKPFPGHEKAYGWQNNYKQFYPELGKRWMANCEVPDLDLLPARYGIKSIRFSAGMELSFMHIGIWIMSWLVRLGLPLDLTNKASFLLNVSNWFDYFGSPDGGMHMIIKGKGKNGKVKEIKWFIIAKDGDGPQIPPIPAIVLAKKLSAGKLLYTGAKPCVGLVSLNEYLNELKEFNISTYHTKNPDCIQKVDHKHDSGTEKNHNDCKNGQDQQQKNNDGHNHTH